MHDMINHDDKKMIRSKRQNHKEEFSNSEEIKDERTRLIEFPFDIPISKNSDDGSLLIKFTKSVTV